MFKHYNAILRNSNFLKLVIGPFLFLHGITTNAQQTKIYLGLGGVYSSFQDARFSNVQYNKFSFFPELGFRRISEKNYWFANGNMSSYTVSMPFVDTIQTKSLGFNTKLGYLRKIKPNLFLGANWDVFDYYKRKTNFLGNNADAYKLSSEFYVSAKYQHELSKDWQFAFGGDYGLLTFINTEPSFSANYQQNIIDNGDVSFIDKETKSPWKIRNMKTRGFWNQFNLRTQSEVTFKQRYALNYTWEIRRFSDNKGYPVTDARHQITFRFHFVKHDKKIKK